VHGAPDFGFLRDRFGLMYIPFALLGWGGSWLRKAGTATPMEIPEQSPLT